MLHVSACWHGDKTPVCGVVAPISGEQPPHFSVRNQRNHANPLENGASEANTVPYRRPLSAGGTLDSHQISCLVGDDHEALRRGLVAVLQAEDDLRVVGEAAD